MVSSQLPNSTKAAAGPAFGPGRRRRLTRRRALTAAGPLPPAPAGRGRHRSDPRLPDLQACPASPFEQYGLFELIRREGHWIGLDDLSSVLHDAVFWHTLLRTIVFTIVQRQPDDRARNADRASARAGGASLVRMLFTAGLVLVWSMPVARRCPGLVLDDELPERRGQLRAEASCTSATSTSTTGTRPRPRNSAS